MKILKPTFFLFTLALVLILSTAAHKTKADFSGDWMLDQQKSFLGEMGGRMVASKLKITQEGNVITIVRTSNGQMGEVVTTDKLAFDGAESTSVGGREGSTRKAALKMAEDQNSLTVNAVTLMSFNGTSFEIRAKEIWTISTDAKVITIDSETTTQMGVTNTKLVYNKQ
ncbi:MAG TPA: hypothetical protein VFE57_05305 [Cyclobacteriaceae bacterium]|nr:hypothetical protein [Cyclobacteriaceae bacterium]